MRREYALCHMTLSYHWLHHSLNKEKVTAYRMSLNALVRIASTARVSSLVVICSKLA